MQKFAWNLQWSHRGHVSGTSTTWTNRPMKIACENLFFLSRKLENAPHQQHKAHFFDCNTLNPSHGHGITTPSIHKLYVRYTTEKSDPFHHK